jgi:hypothetical protein
MPNLETDRLAEEVRDLWVAFQAALSSEKRKYPVGQFQAFWSAAKRYAELTNSDSLFHKSVATAVNGLVDFISAERKRVPAMFFAMQSAWSLLFAGYDPYFEREEPPGL